MSRTLPFSPRRAVLWGLGAIGFLLAGFGTWSTQAQISGAVIAPGRVQLASNRQVVEPAIGGVVRDIHVRKGDRVIEGDLLVQLENDDLLSEQAFIEARFREVIAQVARLEAEAQGEGSLNVPHTRTLLPQLARLYAEEQTLLDARIASYGAATARLDEQMRQVRARIIGIEADLRALSRQLALFGRELEAQRTLFERRLTPMSAVLELERAEVELTGAMGARTAQRLEAEGQLAELEAERSALDTTRREAALTELRASQQIKADLIEQLTRIQARLKATEIRAPQSGLVHDITIFAEQSVVQAGEALLFIVPQDSALVVNAEIDPLHVDSVRVGQIVGLRFPSIDTGPVPDRSGIVIALSPDILLDEATGRAFYLAEIALPGRGLGRASDLPGMPVEAFFKTQARTPLAYLTSPLTSYFSRALREG